MKTTKKLILTTSVIAALTLSGCHSHDNPLEKMSQHEQANFLADADQAAEKAIGYHGNGYAYRDCMEGKIAHAQCQRLYQAMVEYGRKQPGLASLTVADITDAKRWQTLKEEYNGAVFDELPS